MSSENIDPVFFKGTVTRSQFFLAQRLLLPWWAVYVLVVSIIYLFVSFGVGWIVAFQHSPAAFSDISLAALIILVYWCAFRYSMHRAWKKNLELHGEVSGLLNDAGIEWNKSISSTKFPWNKLWYFKEVPKMIVVFYSGDADFIFRKSSLCQTIAGRHSGKLLPPNSQENKANIHATRHISRGMWQ